MPVIKLYFSGIYDEDETIKRLLPQKLKDQYAFKSEMVFIRSFYNERVSQMIVEKYGIEPLLALRKFLFSETYRMLTDEELEMWDFSPFGIFYFLD